MKVRGLSGAVDKVYTADAITFQFANIAQKVEDVVAFDTSSLSKNLNMEVFGLIGYTALAHLAINIDYRDGLMKFAYDPNRGFNRSNSRGSKLEACILSAAHPSPNAKDG